MRVAFVKQMLGHPAFPAVLAALALVLSAPAWRSPFSGDDLVQSSRLLEFHPIKSKVYFADSHRFGPAVMGLFDWFHPGLTRRVMEYGFMPWWAAGDAKQAFWRPLSAATHWLDYRLWPSRARPMHIQSALWFAAFLVGAWALYRRVDGRAWVAGLAALLLALNQENWQPLVWIAARNSLITACFVVLTLGLHHRRVRGASWKWAAGAWGSLAAGLLAGEGAVTAAAYLFSYAAFLDKRPWRTRFLSLAPFAIVVIAWRVAYQALGFGVTHSGLYVDPGGEPVRYLLNLFEWGPILLLDVFASPILGKYAALAPQVQPWAWGLGCLGLLALSAAFVPLVRRDRAARFWAMGLVLTVIPACATTVPDDRITLYAMVGFAPLAATFLAGLVEGGAWLPLGRRLAVFQAAGVLLVGLHVLQPLPGHAKRATYPFRRSPPPTRVEPILAAPPDQELIVVNTSDVMALSYMPFFLAQEGKEIPARLRLLSSSLGDLVVRRTGTNTLMLVAANGPLIPARPRASELPAGAPRQHPLYKGFVIGSAFREETVRFAPGDRTTLPGMTVTVVRVNDRGFPIEAAVVFEQPLDDARYHWVFWDRLTGRFAPFTPLRMGEERRISGPFPPSP